MAQCEYALGVCDWEYPQDIMQVISLVYSKSLGMRPECLSPVRAFVSDPSPSSKLSIGGTFRSGMFGIPIWTLDPFSGVVRMRCSGLKWEYSGW